MYCCYQNLMIVKLRSESETEVVNCTVISMPSNSAPRASRSVNRADSLLWLRSSSRSMDYHFCHGDVFEHVFSHMFDCVFKH